MADSCSSPAPFRDNASWESMF